MKIFTSFIACTILLLNFSANAQEDSGKSKFRSKIDSIVENIFERFDDKLGTYIFRDEPVDNRNAVDSEFTKSENSDGETLTGNRSYHTSSIYAVKPERGIARNIYPSFPWEKIDEDILFRYNRVEGLFLGLNYPQKYYWNERRLRTNSKKKEILSKNWKSF